MNKIILIGRLARDPELKSTQSGSSLVTFTVAVQRNYKNKEGNYDADFINCRAWNRTGEMINQYFSKGKPIGIDGSLRHDSWKDDAGEWHNLTYVNVDSFEFISGGGSSDKEEQPAAEKQQAPKLRQQGLFEADDETALPFDF